MVCALLLCSGLLTAPPPADNPDRATYEDARGKAGRDPDAHVKLALWCEAHGLAAERMRHLALAALIDPKNATARGLMGLVAFQGRWLRPEAVGDKVTADADHAAKMAEYVAKRAKTPYTADAQWKLALWCEENGLKESAVAHLRAVIKLDPSREAAWKRLGYKKEGRRWVTAEQLAAEKREQELQKQADRHWKPLLEKWRGGLAEKGKRHEEAVRALEEVSDPRAVPSVWAVFARGGAASQGVAVQVLGRIDAPAASQDLALLAAFSPSADVRRQAAEILRRRDPRDYAGLLINLLRDPIKYEVRPVAGPGSQGVLFVQGKQANLKRLYSPPSAPYVAVLPGDQFEVDASGQPVISRPTQWAFQTGMLSGVNYASGIPLITPQDVGQRVTDLLTHSGFSHPGSQHLGQTVARNLQQPGAMFKPTANLNDSRPILGYDISMGGHTEIPIGEMVAEAQRAAAVAQQQLANDVQTIERYNAPIKELNRRVRQILSAPAGSDLGEDRRSWQKWYVDLLGYAVAPQQVSQETPTVVEQVPIAFQPQAAPFTIADGPIAVQPIRHSCFGAGTPVKTLTGLRPIETVRAGDLVLSQDGRTGALSYQPVVNAFHNPPNATYRIRLGAEAVVATGIHRFWKAGKGWVMARDLKPGDTLRTLGGVAEVTAVDSDRVQSVYNLEVAQGQSFFVGARGVLVHDNSPVQPVTEPFDAAPALVAQAEK